MSVELSEYDRMELGEYTHEERMILFYTAVFHMSEKGIISPKQTKTILKELNKWLLEELEN